jgi:diguanylate cyclase
MGLLVVGVAWILSAFLLAGPTTAVIVVTPLAFVALVILAVAPSLHQPRRSAPWRLLLGAEAALVAGLVVRPEELDQAGALPLGHAVVALAAYGLVALAAHSFLRDHIDRDRGSFQDALLVAAGASAPIAVFLVLPAMELAHGSSMSALIAGVFPLVDLLLLHLLARLAFAVPTRPAALRLLIGAAAMLFVADFVWGLVAGGAVEVPVQLLDLAYVASLVAVAAAALHPSMRQLTVPSVRRTRALRSGRLVVILGALVAPAAVVALADLDRPIERGIVAASMVAGALGAVRRARRAVAEHATNEERLAHMATHDALTRLPNRRLALEQITINLSAARTHGRRTALLVVDLDRFKLINDAWGHPVGDQLLVAVAERLRRCVREGDLVARMSGDAFLVVLADADEAAARRTAASIMRHMVPHFRLSIGEVGMTVSIGLAVAAEGDPDELVRNADIALFRAKVDGRNRYAVFDASMHDAVTDRYLLEHDLRRAVARQEFAVHYQPIVGLKDQRVLGYEALLRWNRPVEGPVLPRRFVPVLEESDLILEVGAFVLREAVGQLARWHEAGQDVYVSVNVAARQLRCGLLVEQVGSLLDEFDVPPDHLLLELTESLLIEESPVVRETMDGLTLLGVGLALDDFGTGHSSLQYLTRFPVSAVKIDRSFVHGLSRDVDCLAIVQAVVGMSHGLGLTVIAEGVETAQQRRQLKQLGCDAFQGYIEGAPEAAAQLRPVRPVLRRL